MTPRRTQGSEFGPTEENISIQKKEKPSLSIAYS